MTNARLPALPLVAAFALALALNLTLAQPARAEVPLPDGSDPEIGEGLSLLEEGAGILLRSLRKRMEPALRDLGSDLDEAMRAMGPALGDLVAMIGDMRNYHAPEKLPNGDIILRRKTPPAPEADPGAPDTGPDSGPESESGPEPGAAIDL